jgi:hypothetical protein
MNNEDTDEADINKNYRDRSGRPNNHSRLFLKMTRMPLSPQVKRD